MKYYGEFSNGQLSGKGQMEVNGKVFVSDFSNGIPQGSGTIFYKDGDVYIGEIQNGQPNGQGKSYYLAYYRSKYRYSYSEGMYVKGKLVNGYNYNALRLTRKYSSPSASVRQTDNVLVESGKNQYYAYAEPKITELELQKEYTDLMSELKKFPGEKLTKEDIKFSKRISTQ